MDLEEGTPYLGTSLGCLRRASALWSRHDAHQDKSVLDHLRDWGEILPRNMGCFGVLRVRAFWDYAGVLTGCLEEAL